MRRPLLGFFCFALLAAPGSSHASELRSSYPEHDASGADFQKELLARWRATRTPVSKAAQDRDLHNIAILEDDGTLLGRDSNQLLVTNSGTIAQRFYASHGDDFDYLVIFVASTYPEDVYPEGGFAFQFNVANSVAGIGLPSFNNGAQIAPSITRLKSLLNMNDLGEYPDNPGEGLPSFLNTFSGVEVLAQEAAHMVGAFVRANNTDILGRGNNHWSFFFETYGSVLEGNGWHDNGNGTYTTVASSVGYSQLDLYLWGLLPAAAVTDPMYVLQNPRPNLGSTQQGDASLPVPGVTVSATGRTMVTLANITQIHGSRQPSAATSQKTFSMGWILVIPPGTQPAPRDLEKIDDFRTQWEEDFFPAETNGIGSVVSRLGPAPVVADFEARVFAGTPGLTVRFDNDSFGDISSFEWDFGDGNVSSERHPTHTYAETGRYTVRLTVHGEGGPVVVEKPAFVHVGSEAVWFEDDFETNKGWLLGNRDTAFTGRWERSLPIPSRLSGQFGNQNIGVDVQPGTDHTPNGVMCLVTGNSSPNASIGTNDVDGGTTTILSPTLDLSRATDPILSFWHWYSNNVGATPGRDSLCVDASTDGGNTWTPLVAFVSSHHFWREEQLHLTDYVALTNTMRIRFRAADEGGGSLVEAAVDDVRIFDVDTSTPVSVQELAATSTATGVRLSWRLSPETVRTLSTVSVDRAATAEGTWREIATLVPDPEMSLEDATAQRGVVTWYRLRLTDSRGERTSARVSILHAGNGGPTEVSSAVESDDGAVGIRYSLATRADAVRIDIFDAAGRRVQSLPQGRREPGAYWVSWDRRTHSGARAPRGVYFLHLLAARDAATHKLVLLR